MLCDTAPEAAALLRRRSADFIRARRPPQAFNQRPDICLHLPSFVSQFDRPLTPAAGPYMSQSCFFESFDVCKSLNFLEPIFGFYLSNRNVRQNPRNSASSGPSSRPQGLYSRTGRSDGPEGTGGGAVRGAENETCKISDGTSYG